MVPQKEIDYGSSGPPKQPRQGPRTNINYLELLATSFGEGGDHISKFLNLKGWEGIVGNQVTYLGGYNN